VTFQSYVLSCRSVCGSRPNSGSLSLPSQAQAHHTTMPNIVTAIPIVPRMSSTPGGYGVSDHMTCSAAASTPINSGKASRRAQAHTIRKHPSTNRKNNAEAATALRAGLVTKWSGVLMLRSLPL
jgi:hypothetical protein